MGTESPTRAKLPEFIVPVLDGCVRAQRSFARASRANASCAFAASTVLEQALCTNSECIGSKRSPR
jgi:hypothetical protein